MDKFLIRKTTPTPKQVITPKNTDKKETAKVYESNKRKRKIVPTWKTEFQWLITDDEETLYCKICRSVYGPLGNSKHVHPEKYRRYSAGSFVRGCTSLRHDGLVDHGKSQGHLEAVQVHLARTATPEEKASLPAAKMLQTLNDKNFDRMRKLFINAHALIKHSRPITDFEWMCEADERKGVDIGPTYRNKSSCKQFLVAISETVRSNIEEKLKNASFISVMADGSTDISTVENEIVYLHFSVQGEVQCYFIGMIECESGNAAGVFCAIMKALQFESLSREEILKKIVGYVGDGASVNTGAANGVISMIREKADPSVLMVTCLSHRVELAFKDSLKKSKTFQEVLDLLDQLFKFYHKSPKQTAGLKQSFEALKQSFISFSRVGGTRWVGHTQTALKNFFRAYKPTLMHLSQVAITRTQSSAQSKAKNLLSKMRSESVIIFSHFLADVLACLVKFSMHLQERKTCMYQVHQQMNTSLTSLKKLLERPGPEERKAENFNGVYQGETLKRAAVLPRAKEIPEAVQSLINSIEKRFSDVQSGVLNATRLVDLSTWPAEKEDSSEFGDDHLACILDHFRSVLEQNGVDLPAAEVEWTELKEVLYSSYKVHTLEWSTAFTLFKNRMPNILKVVDLLLSLPAGSSECERGFSAMKIIKTQYRNRMKSTTLTLLMTIQLHTPDVKDFDPDHAIKQWMTHHHRRPNFMKTEKQQLLQILESDQYGDDEDAEVAAAEKSDADDSDFADLGFDEYESDGEF